MLLRTLARVQCWLYFLSLLATVRGGTSFLGPSATKKRSKENAFPQSVLSVPSVQTTAFGSRVARCSLEPRTLETLLLANPDIPTLRHQCSRASSMAHGPIRLHGSKASLSVRGLRNPRDHLSEEESEWPAIRLAPAHRKNSGMPSARHGHPPLMSLHPERSTFPEIRVRPN